MASKQSDKNRYPSRYSPNGWVRSDQYIIELICEKKAKTLNKDLPIKFWNDSEWEKFFKSQLRKCKSLLQKYSAEAIIKALQDQKAWNIYSLFAPWLEDIIQIYHNKINKTQTTDASPEISGTNFIRKSYKNKKNIIDILKDI